jgi:uncharacterized protein (DUF885 family)
MRSATTRFRVVGAALLSFVALVTMPGCTGDRLDPPASPAVAAATSFAEAERETGRLNAWLDARYEEQLDFHPLAKTMLGRKDDYDEIDDMSEAGEDAELAWHRETVADLKSTFDRGKLTAEGQTSYDLWIYMLQEREDALPFRRRGYQFNQLYGMHTELPADLINFHRVDEERDMVAYIARLREVGRALRQVQVRAEVAAREGVHAPRFAYEAVATQARAVVTGAPFEGAADAPLWADAKSKTAALVDAGKISPVRADELKRDAEAALTNDLKPAYDELIAWVDEELAAADPVATGIWKLPDGPAAYAEALRANTTTNMTADEIHTLGLAEVARIRAEMETIKAKVGFRGTLREFFTYLRDDPRFQFPDTDAGRKAYLQAAQSFYAGIEKRLPDFFGILPKGGIEVRRVEPFREVPGAPQSYVPGTPDGSRSATYYVHLSDMTSMPKPVMEGIAYHEGIPGHHMQIAIAQELTGVPRFRTQAGFTAFSEGWGLYAESLAKEMGGYQDPYSDFGRLTTEMWRAIRLVVDTGLHEKRWSEQQAVDYFRENSSMAEGQMREEVRRYLVWPAQATSYKIGMLKIQELRARSELELGAKFDIRAFHDTVLGGGALPLPLLERRVDEWIARTKSE